MKRFCKLRKNSNLWDQRGSGKLAHEMYELQTCQNRDKSIREDHLRMPKLNQDIATFESWLDVSIKDLEQEVGKIIG